MSNNTQPRRRYPSAEELKTQAAGRWFDILIAAGIPADRLDGRGHQCPKCGGNDRFAAFPNINGRGAVHCRQCFTRGTDPSPGDGLSTLGWILGLDFVATLAWLADYLGIQTNADSTRQRPQPKRHVAPEATAEPEYDAIDFDELAKQFFVECSRERCERLAKRLSVPFQTLTQLRVGYSEQHQATTWPMVDSGGRCVGLRLRGHDGDKWSYRGGKAGIFVPDGMTTAPKRLYVGEGPTDTAAMLSIGLDAIGRASASGNVATVANFVRRLGCDNVVVVADHDSPGRVGAMRLANVLVTVAECVRVITPGRPGDDVRSMVAAGMDAYDINELVGEATPMTLGVHRSVKRQRAARRRNRR